MKVLDDLKYDDLRLNLSTREASRAGFKIVFSNKEFQIIEYFMKNVGRVITKLELFENVWDSNGFVVTNTIEVHIRNLRKKLDIPFTKPLIHTVYCAGYRFF